MEPFLYQAANSRVWIPAPVPSSSGSGSWCQEPRAGHSSKSPWWCVPAPLAAGHAPAPPLRWRRSCSKSSRSDDVSWLRCQMPRRSCHPRCRCCCCCFLGPAGTSSGDVAGSLCGKRSSSPGQLRWGPARCTHQRQSTGLLAQDFLEEEEEENIWEMTTIYAESKYDSSTGCTPLTRPQSFDGYKYCLSTWQTA